MHRSLSSRSLVRGAVLGVVLAVVAFLPGVAWAGDGSGLPALPTDQLGSVTGTVGDVLSGQGGAPVAPQGGVAPNANTAAGAGTRQTGLAPALSPPSQLDASQLQQLLAALGISQDCSDAVQADLQKAIEDLPATVQAILDSIVSQLPSTSSSPLSATDPQTGATVLLQQLGNGQLPQFSSPDPTELPTVKDLQQLADDLQNKCQPTLPGTPPAGGSQLPPPQQQPVSAPQPQAPAPAPVQPVSYPGYAPTGAPPVHPSDGAPLAALAGIVVLSAAGAASYRMVFRAGPRP